MNAELCMKVKKRRLGKDHITRKSLYKITALMFWKEIEYQRTVIELRRDVNQSSLEIFQRIFGPNRGQIKYEALKKFMTT